MDKLTKDVHFEINKEHNTNEQLTYESKEFVTNVDDEWYLDGDVKPNDINQNFVGDVKKTYDNI